MNCSIKSWLPHRKEQPPMPQQRDTDERVRRDRCHVRPGINHCSIIHGWPATTLPLEIPPLLFGLHPTALGASAGTRRLAGWWRRPEPLANQLGHPDESPLAVLPLRAFLSHHNTKAPLHQPSLEMLQQSASLKGTQARAMRKIQNQLNAGISGVDPLPPGTG